MYAAATAAQLAAAAARDDRPAGLGRARLSVPHPDGRSGERAGRGVGAPVEPVSRQAGLVAQLSASATLPFMGSGLLVRLERNKALTHTPSEPGAPRRFPAAALATFLFSVARAWDGAIGTGWYTRQQETSIILAYRPASIPRATSLKTHTGSELVQQPRVP